MKKIIANLACICLGIALFAGCQSADNGNNKTSANPTSPMHVALLFSKPKQAYVAVGMVSTYKVQPDPSQTWQNTFQKQAAARGADAVIVDTSTLNNINTPMVSGTAIRYQTNQ